MVADSGLRQAEWLREVADARFAGGLRLNETQQSQPGRVREHLQRGSKSICVAGVERTREQRRARSGERRERVHRDILTGIDALGRLTRTLIDIDASEATSESPEVLFVCVHNAGRSQMAAGLVDLRSGGRIHVRSAGSTPADEINPAVVEAMAEVGVDLSQEFPKPLTDDVVRAADVVITMGCGDACPIYPGKKYEDWELDDPAGQNLETARRIRDEIDARVRKLVAELLPA